MNSNVDCSACTELKENASEFVQKGVTKTVCTSLKNNTGFNPSLTTLHDDCEDLDTATDCMIGMMEKEIDSYDVCDWREFMKKFINNLTQLLKAIICSICGLWDRTDALCDLIGSSIAPPLRDYAVLPLRTSGSDTGHSTSHVRFHADDGTLNPYTKHSQGVGISYAKLETTDCATGQCTVYEWIQPKIYLTYITENTQNDDVLWYATKSELQAACGFSDYLWEVFTESWWTWRDASQITNGASIGKSVWLEIGVDAGGVGTDKLAVVYHGTSYPWEEELTYDIYPSALQNIPRLYTHKC